MSSKTIHLYLEDVTIWNFCKSELSNVCNLDIPNNNLATMKFLTRGNFNI